ncbi:MAG: DNA polymerase III subunit gamma/tau, partial [Cyanobacteriota bacterium]|nr:DNA polymerase III subunit gamma/tau [Cyanobacteriota bacterium]
IAAGTALDVIEIDAASNTGVDNIRELIERSRFAPVQARWKVYVVDECHMLSTAAFNALLKTLEEPPPQVVFVLATTDPQRVLPTILSRCQRFDFRRIPVDALNKHLSWIAEQEAIEIKPEAIHVVAQRSQGGLRDAESLLDQLSLLPPPIEAAAVWDLLGAVPEQELLELVGAMSSAEPVQLLEATRNLLDRGRDPGAVLQGLAGLLRDLVLMAAAPDRLELTSVSPQFREQLPALAKTIGRARLLQWQTQLRGTEQQLRQSVQPRLWLEVLLLGLLAEPVAAQSAAAVTAPRQRTRTQPAAASPPTTQLAPPAPTPSAAPPAVATAIEAPSPSPKPAPAQSPELPSVFNPAPAASTNLPELWQQILGSLELPSTRMLLSQQAQLVLLDANRAVVQVADNWMGMVQSRASLLEQAVAKALGGSRQLVLETSSNAMPPPMATAPVTTPSITPLPIATAPIAKAPGAVELPAPTPAPMPSPTAAPIPAPPATPGPAPAVAPELPRTQTEPIEPKPTPTRVESSPQPSPPSGLDRQARNLADFFNGQVLDVDDVN